MPPSHELDELKEKACSLVILRTSWADGILLFRLTKVKPMLLACMHIYLASLEGGGFSKEYLMHGWSDGNLLPTTGG